MTRLLLVRHGAVESMDHTLNGRRPGVALSAPGRQQVRELAQRLSSLPVAAVYSGPLERVRATAAAIAAPHGLEPRVVAAFHEVDFGRWQGRCFAELEEDPLWRRYNQWRSLTRPPGGEHPIETQARVVVGLLEVVARHPEETVVVVSHGEPIRLALAYFLGISMDMALRVEVAAGEVKEIEGLESCRVTLR